MQTSMRVLDCQQYSRKDITFFNTDCLTALKALPDKSVALVVADPPYGGHTHNQQTWDVAWSDEEWIAIIREVYRVLIVGGHMIVFCSGKSTLDINYSIVDGYKTLFKKKPSYYPMVWVHNSLDSGRVHSHTPRSQFESMHVYYREGEGRGMEKAGTFSKSYAYDQHVGRHNVFHFDKDDCHKKPFRTVQEYFKKLKAQGKHLSTFDNKPEPLMRALVRDYSNPGHLVVDLCMRHGITGVACQMEQRAFIGMEFEAESYTLAVNRFKDQFGEIEPLYVSPSTSIRSTPQPEEQQSIRVSTSIFADSPVTSTSLEGIVAKAKSIVQLSTPIHPRPRGRSPKDSRWDTNRGLWVSSQPDEDGYEVDHMSDDEPPIVTPTKKRRMCGTPGCILPDHHIGLCSCASVHKRTRSRH
jgi:site-specific DNA-methyltransferase (adenine-specific)